MRLFIAIPLDESIVSALAAFVQKIASPISSPISSPLSGLRWTNSESWHITLQFLGSTKPEQYGCVVKQLNDVSANSFAIELGGFGAFERAGVFFVSVAVNPELISLQQRVTSATVPCGFSAESRPYSPHITLARAKGHAGGQQLQPLSKHRAQRSGPRSSSRLSQAQPELCSLKAAAADQARANQASVGRFQATEFRLYESFTLPTGSRYEVRERFLLTG